MIFGSLLTKVKPRKIESERRSASKTSNLRISLFTSIKDRHCIQTTRILVNRPAINANDPMPHLPDSQARCSRGRRPSLAESVLSSTYWGREDDLDIEYIH